VIPLESGMEWLLLASSPIVEEINVPRLSMILW